MFRRTRILIAIGAGLALGLPTAASASTVHISGTDDVVFEADPGEDNVVEIDEQAALLTIEDTAGLTAGPGCAQVDVQLATCPLAAFDGVFAYLGNGENTVNASLGDSIYVDGSQGAENEIYAYTWNGATLVGGPGPDDLDAGPGNDGLYGNGGNDKLEDGWGIDVVQGGDDDDEITPDLGNDDIQGGDGFDTVSYRYRGDPQHLSIDNAANDGQDSEADNIHTDVERLEGGSGGDEITGSDGADEIAGRGGDDTVRGGAGEDDLDGGTGDDDLRGEFDADTIDGGPDQDTINGGFSGDEVMGGTGNDTVDGSIGEDEVSGGPDHDSLLGGAGSDKLSGDAGDDNLQGQAGADILAGSIGTDTVDYSAYTSPITVDLDGSPFDDGIENEGDSVRADVENVIGGSGNDTITGNGLANVLTGGAGDDRLFSQDGTPDTLECGVGNDTAEADAVDAQSECELPAQAGADGGGAQPGGQAPAAPGALAGLKIGPSTARLSRSRVVTLKVSCSTGGAACTGTLRLQRKVKGKARSFGSKRFNVPAGAKRKVRIKVSKRTAKSIARRPLRVTAVAGDASRKVTLKPAARRKH